MKTNEIFLITIFFSKYSSKLARPGVIVSLQLSGAALPERPCEIAVFGYSVKDPYAMLMLA